CGSPIPSPKTQSDFQHQTHSELMYRPGDKPGVVVCEIPAQPQWCEIRTTVFSWTLKPTRFPLKIGSAKNLTFGESPIITVIGKAMWDVGHAPKEQKQPSQVHAGLRCLGDSSGDAIKGSVNRTPDFALASGRTSQ